MEFTIVINAPRATVWKTLWEDETYRKWTAPFSQGSRAVTDWKKGSKVLFLDAKNSGMFSVIKENIPNEYMSIEHLGSVVNGQEILDSEDAKQWAGAFENYTLRESDGNTELYVSMGGAEIPKEFEDYFKAAWPKALNKLKELSENN